MADLPRVFVETGDWRAKFEENLTGCLKTLLEKKHLYQSLTVSVDIKPRKASTSAEKLKAERETWDVLDNATSPSAYSREARFTLRAPDVKLFCHVCKRVEAFNSISTVELTGRAKEEHSGKPTNGAAQVFGLSFLCQSCKGVPEVFLLRRQGLKLTLCGRAPMEVAQVPRVIPETIRRYYSGALVAHQSGQTLAGLFLLRTLIEQWARSQVRNPSPRRADELMKKYMAILPTDFKRNSPSIRYLYDDISADLHDAVGSSDLFDRALKKIGEHFEARKVFKL